MKKSELRQIIKEETATQSFVKDAKAIDATLNKLNSWWGKQKTGLKKQLKNDPESWSGIGGGAELANFKYELNELWNAIKNWKLGE